MRRLLRTALLLLLLGLGPLTPALVFAQRDARNLSEQRQAVTRGATALRAAIGSVQGIRSVLADERGVVISIAPDFWHALTVQQRQTLADRFMAVVLSENGNIAVPIEVVAGRRRVAVSFNNPMRMVLLH